MLAIQNGGTTELSPPDIERHSAETQTLHRPAARILAPSPLLALVGKALQQTRPAGASANVLKNIIVLSRPTYSEILELGILSDSSQPVLAIAETSALTMHDLNQLQRRPPASLKRRTLPESSQAGSRENVVVVDAAFPATFVKAVEDAWNSTSSTLILISGSIDQLERLDESEELGTDERAHEDAGFRRCIVPEEVARADRQAIWKKTFSAAARRWIAKYNTVGERDLYLWQWCLHGIQLTRLPIVETCWEQHVDDTKLLSVILCVLFDDVADRRVDLSVDSKDRVCETQNCRSSQEWLQALIEATRQSRADVTAGQFRFSEEIERHIEITAELWQEYLDRLRMLPRFSEFESLWRFDIEQFFTAMRYGQLMNSLPEITNPTEHDIYTPHNMLMVSFATIDMMGSSTEEVSLPEMGRIREAIWHTQAMGRIGNQLSTWKRELGQGDLSNGLIARAIADGLMTTAEARTLSPQQVEHRLHGSSYEQDLMDTWERHRATSRTIAASVCSVDLTDVLDAHDRFLNMHLSNQGRI